MSTESLRRYRADFLIVTTLDNEFSSLLAILSLSADPINFGTKDYHVFDLPIVLPTGTSSAYRIVVVQTEIGTVRAAITTNNAIREWNPRYIMVIGAAGGISRSGVRVGDILLADQVVNYEQQKITSTGIQPRWDVYRTDPRLLKGARHLKMSSWIKLIKSKRPTVGKPKVHIGPIASGNTIFASTEGIDGLLQHWPRLIGVEMEAGGVAAAILNAAESPGFLVVRAVVDTMDESKIDNWQEYGAAAAAAFTVGLLKSVPIEPSPHARELFVDRQRGLKIFCSYARPDEKFRRELETQLKLLHHSRVVDIWFDRDIDAGDDWRSKIDSNLERADLVLLLISADFLSSDYAYGIEMERALGLQRIGQAQVVPVILRDVSLSGLPLGDLQSLPRDGRPISSWKDRDAAWRSVSEGIERIAQQLQGTSGTETNEPLLIDEISLENIRCFETLNLSFRSDLGTRRFTLLFGDNGAGKSTLLRCIALGLCDETTATALIEMLPATLLRDKAKKGVIRVKLSIPGKDKSWTIETTLRRKASGEVAIVQSSPNDFPRKRVFACGYGSARRGFGSQDHSYFALKNSLITLFNYDSSLQNPELAFRRIQDQKISVRDLTQKIDSVLMLEPGSTRIDSSGINISGPWGEFKPLGGLGDGFQATLGWIADLLGWACYFDPEFLQAGLSGIVLLDELEQHLHPFWQREIIRLLHKQFPNVQFIVTSHSPMCALGTTALPAATAEILRLRQGDTGVEATQLSVPMNKRADQVLTSPLFGLFSASGFDVASDLEHFTRLASNDERNDAEQIEYLELEGRLERVLGPFRSDLERRIHDRVRDAMNKELASTLRAGKLNSKAVDMAIRHRIRDFLGEVMKNDPNKLQRAAHCCLEKLAASVRGSASSTRSGVRFRTCRKGIQQVVSRTEATVLGP